MTTKNTIISQQGATANSIRHLGLPAEEYHASIDRQSCSQLKPMLESPASYARAMISRQGPTGDAIDFGTLVHAHVLEPHLFAQMVAVYPGAVLAGSRDQDFAKFKKSHSGRLVIDEHGLENIRLACDKLLEQRVFGRPFGDFVAEGEKEVTYFFDDPTTRTPCRCRMDLVHDEANFDIKTSSVSGNWVRHATTLSYDMQSYMYSLAECLFRGSDSSKPFVFMCVDSDQPYSTKARVAGSSFMEQGKKKYEYAMTLLAACQKTDFWPGPSGEEVIELSPWDTFVPPTGPWTRLSG